MKLVQAAKTLETNAEFTSQDFTIGDVSVVIEILRNKLYRHKVRTLVQEYISNARDATREIKGKTPIEITVPTMFQPTFKVRDFGPGISPDRMYNVFIKYAASTKRGSNLQTGGFGIGAKSAWSYTESFTIVTFIDGVQRTYIAHIGANNNGRLDYLGEAKTDAPNGTEIQIPVSPKDVTEFKTAAFRAVYFWDDKEQPVFKNLVQGDKEERNIGETLGNLEINNKLPSYIMNSYQTGAILAIDGIPYLVDASLIDKCPAFEKLTRSVIGRMIIHVKTGKLEVSASREEISDSKLTLDSLNEIGKKSHKSIVDFLTNKFKVATTPFEHLSVYMELKDKYNLEDYRKCGNFTVNVDNAIESDLFLKVNIEKCSIHTPSFKLLKQDLAKGRRRRRWPSSRKMIKSEWFNSLYYIDGTEPMLITNYRIRTLLATNPNVIVFTAHADDTLTKTGTFATLKNDLCLKDLKTVNYTKPDRKAREIIKVERTKQSFCLHDMGRFRNRVKHVTLDSNTETWLYVEKTDTLDTLELRELSSYLDLNICALGQDAIRRVKGDKKFKPLADFLKSYKATVRDVNNMKGKFAKNCELMDNLKTIPVKDKFLTKMIQEYKDLTVLDIPKTLATAIGSLKEVDDFKEDDKKLTEVLKLYPLLKHINWYSINSELKTEISFYINVR
jgi:hypothetical protein